MSEFSEAATVVVIESDKVLVLKRSKSAKSFKGYWNFPGGSVEDGESYPQAAVRELKEEANLDMLEPDLQYLGYLTRHKLRVHIFASDKYQGQVSINHESDEFVWAPIDDLDKFLFVGGGKVEPEIIRKVKKYMEKQSAINN